MYSNTTESLWKWEKHNVLYFIERNNLLEFTVETFCRKASGSKYHCFGYDDKVISDCLLQLLNEKRIQAYYVSQGSKTITIYKSLKACREEKINKILS